MTEAGGENKDERELTTQDCKTDAFQSEKINGRLINLRVVLFIFDILTRGTLLTTRNELSLKIHGVVISSLFLISAPGSPTFNKTKGKSDPLNKYLSC